MEEGPRSQAHSNSLAFCGPSACVMYMDGFNHRLHIAGSRICCQVKATWSKLRTKIRAAKIDAIIVHKNHFETYRLESASPPFGHPFREQLVECLAWLLPGSSSPRLTYPLARDYTHHGSIWVCCGTGSTDAHCCAAVWCCGQWCRSQQASAGGNSPDC